jgi:pimeloyl-ACP methyl ester carboxylesterase
MHRIFPIFALAVFAPLSAHAQFSAAPPDNTPMKTTYVRLANNANAILVEPVTLDPVKSRIAVIVTHPEHVNNFNYFIGRALPPYGYRVLMLNYYGPEQTYYEFLAPIAAAIKALRAIPGVEKVVLAGHSSGGPVITSYQDVAENGPKACQGPERVYKCDGKGLDNLPKADGVMLLDSAAGSPERTDALNPAVDPHHPRQHNAELDMFDPKNGFNPATHAATYSPEFLKKYFAAQAARSSQLIDEAQARLAKIEKGEGEYKDDEPFVVAGSTVRINGARPQLADTRLMSKSHAPHLLLKTDGTKPMQIIPQVFAPQASPDDQDLLFATTLNVTVSHYLSFQALRVTPQYHMTEDNIVGVQWRSTPNSVPGNLEGIKVPTLVMSGTCAPHVVYLEIAYDHSAASDKEMAGVEGADHGFLPCRPEYGDTFKRTFDFVDGWLSKPGRF